MILLDKLIASQLVKYFSPYRESEGESFALPQPSRVKQSKTAWALQLGLIHRPETSSQRLRELRPQLQRGWSLKSCAIRTVRHCFLFWPHFHVQFIKILFSITLHSTSGFIFFFLRYILRAVPIPFLSHVIMLMVFSEEYSSRSASFSTSALHPPPSSCPNLQFSVLFSNALIFTLFHVF